MRKAFNLLSSSLLPSSSLVNTFISVTFGFPTVSVPVLSNTTQSTFAICSKTSPPRNKIPLLAAKLVATNTAVGVAKPKAHGHATTKTFVANFVGASHQGIPAAFEPTASINAPGKNVSPNPAQKTKVANEIPMTEYTKGPAMASAMRCVGAGLLCASSTVF